MIENKIKSLVKKIPQINRLLSQRDQALARINSLETDKSTLSKTISSLTSRISNLNNEISLLNAQKCFNSSQVVNNSTGNEKWWNSLALFDTFDLGKVNSEFSGIYSTGYSEAEISTYMTSHYNSEKGAQDLAQIFYNGYDFFDKQIPRILKYTDLNSKNEQSLNIIDIGCGLGVSTLSLIKIFPNANIIASELSPFLLKTFRDKLIQDGLSSRCTLLQLNAEKILFKNDSFDLVLGAAILHHLLQPELVFMSCSKVLKKGGYAIFFEPFEYGYGICSLLLGSILKDPRSSELPDSTKAQVNSFRNVWKIHIGHDKSSPYFQTSDDKWIFSITYLADLAKKYDLELIKTISVVESQNPFLETIKSMIPQNQLPEWAWESIKEGGDCFSDEAKKELFADGCIAFRKK